MAFQNVNNGKMAKLTELKVGESLVGYYLGAKESTQYEGQYTMILQVAGERVSVPAVGNTKYAVQDGKLTPGLNTRFTREDDKKVKGGKKATQCSIEQDPDDKIELPINMPALVASNKSATADASGISAKIASLKG